MKKTIIISLTLLFATILTGCNGAQPAPTAIAGKSKASTLSNNDTSVLTLPIKFSFGETTINIEDGSTLSFGQKPKQLLTF